MALDETSKLVKPTSGPDTLNGNNRPNVIDYATPCLEISWRWVQASSVVQLM